MHRCEGILHIDEGTGLKQGIMAWNESNCTAMTNTTKVGHLPNSKFKILSLINKSPHCFERKMEIGLKSSESAIP